MSIFAKSNVRTRVAEPRSARIGVIVPQMFHTMILVELNDEEIASGTPLVNKLSDTGGAFMSVDDFVNKAGTPAELGVMDPVPRSLRSIAALFGAICERAMPVGAITLAPTMSRALRESGDTHAPYVTLRTALSANGATDVAAIINLMKNLAHVVALNILFTGRANLKPQNLVHFCYLTHCIPASVIALAKEQTEDKEATE